MLEKIEGKVRFHALDGIRGLAALTVLWSHGGFFTFGILNGDQVKFTFFGSLIKTLVAGTMGVQILFVLCGFLIAYFYEEISNPLHFIHKRYSRIFPLYTAVVIFTFLSQQFLFKFGIWINLLFLLFIALVWNYFWVKVVRSDKSGKFAIRLFIGFVIFQVTMIIFNSIYLQKFIVNSTIDLSPSAKLIIGFLSNLSLAVPFNKYVSTYQGPFWSLLPEVLFYVLFGLILCRISNKLKHLPLYQKILGILSILTIIFALSSTFRSVLNLAQMSIDRSSGFLVGMIVGVSFKSQNQLYKSVVRINNNRIGSWLAFLGIFVTLILNWAWAPLHSFEFMFFYWLFVSTLIAVTIASSMISRSISYKFYNMKFLRFVGLVSYSLYLSHSIVIGLFASKLSGISGVMYSITITTICLVISYVLYTLVEKPYFDRKPLANAINSASISYPKISGMKIKTIVLIIYLMSTFYIFQMGISFGLRVNLLSDIFKEKMQVVDSVTMLQKRKIQFSFKARENNLALISFDLRFSGDAEKARAQKTRSKLIFRIKEEGSRNWLIESSRDGFETFGQFRYPFGFPSQHNSKAKIYFGELEQVGGSDLDSVILKKYPSSILIAYNFSLKDQLKSPTQLIGLVINRSMLVVTNIYFQLFLIGNITIIILTSKINVRHLFKNKKL